MMLAICPRAELLARWRKAFPEGRVLATIPRAPLTVAPSQLWLHADGIADPDLGRRVAALVAVCPGVPVVVISTAPNQYRALLALEAGASGFCHALAAPELMQQVATVVAHGGLWVGPELMKRMLGAVTARLDQGGGGSVADLSRLTPRERAVATEVSRGATNKEAARTLGITERTVKAHLAAVFEKFGVRDRLELVIALRDPLAAPARSVA
ncbi:MAG: response regulator transcription factor [Zoogloeaceae bacterium]|nr:response regulator transcription factor [Rhodocyclaceae bacterium]MCP5234742.1 response regulator transcription factor [Zoogloeaceae bacterium]